MLTRDKAQIMMLCGALYDIAEKCNDAYTKSQVFSCVLKMQEILLNDGMVKSELKKSLQK